MYGNCIESVQTMLKANADFESKLKVFDYKWLLHEAKIVMTGLDTKVNLRVSLHGMMMTSILLK